jgi:hypothetical protein
MTVNYIDFVVTQIIQSKILTRLLNVYFSKNRMFYLRFWSI